LSLEGTGPYPDFVGRNQWRTVPGVQDHSNYHLRLNYISKSKI
jgi:hypothetical protein